MNASPDDPTRLADETGDATALERDLVRAGKARRLAAPDKERIWTGLAAMLAPPSGPPGHGASTAAAAKIAGGKALVSGVVLKGAIVVVALGGGSIAGYRALHGGPAARAPAATTAFAPSSSPPLVEVPPRASVEEPRLDRAAPAAVEASAPASRRASPSRLAAEGRVVLEARADVREGRPEDALRVLEASRAAFADGALAQEREALTIEALARTGRRAEASRRAAAFLRAHPESPHAATVRAFASP
jgi:hypothetical protein